MSESLQDQLLKAGLISKDRANKVKKQRHQNRPKGKKPPGLSDSQRLAQEAAARDAARARESNLKRDELFRQKDAAGQVRQLIHENKADRRGAEIAYKFTQGSSIRQIMVTAGLLEKIVAGQQAIVSVKERFELVPRAVAERIEERVPGTVVVLLTPHEEQSEDPDDPYGEFKVPDDLIW